MKKGSFHSAGRLDVEMFINRFRLQRFIFTAGGVAFDITGFTWALNIKQNVGSWTSLLTLTTSGGGLSFPAYETNILDARFEASQVNVPAIKEGPAYWELVRTDTNEIWVSGDILFKYGLLDSGGLDQEVTVNLSNETVTVDLAAIVNVNGGGSSSSFSIPDYNDFETSGLPTGIAAGYIARIVTVDPDYTDTIGGVQYYNNKIIYFDGTNWTSWAADFGTP